MKRLRLSNTVFVFLSVVVFPVYPVFGAVLYNISGGIQNFAIDTTSIIDDEFDQEDAEFISADIPLERDHNWANRKESIVYIIQEGDTLGQLARDFGISRDTIRWVNSLPSNTLRVGQKLIIPPGNGFVYSSVDGDSLESIARKYNTTPTALLENNPHISHGLQVNMLIYLPGMKPPVTTPDSIKKEDEEASLENLSTYKLRLINAK